MCAYRIKAPIKKIIDVFRQKNFAPQTIQQIAKELGEHENTINQRIIRDNNDCFETLKKKPRTIRLREGKEKIVFYLRDNQCHACKKKVPIEDLQIHLLNPRVQNKLAWNNLVALCSECAGKPLPKQGAGKKAKQPQRRDRPQWEYKTILIRAQQGVEEKDVEYQGIPGLNTKQSVNFTFYEYNEIEDINEVDEEEWTHFVDDEENITSLTIADILDDFGEDGWELAHVRDLRPQNPQNTWDALQWGNANKEQVWECILKRQRNIDNE